MTEFCDLPERLRAKYDLLFSLLDKSKSIAFFTGAGISTSANIPDFRGDKGLDKAPLNIAQMGLAERDLDSKMPTIGHRAISLLIEKDERFKFVATSNHDGLHQKSGTPWEKSANVFGTAFIEECLSCKNRFIRKTITPALNRYCDNDGCVGKLKKTGVRYGQTVPAEPLEKAEKAAKFADLVLVLGSSMRTYPFCDLPTLSPCFVICNRQKTPYDTDAEICIHDHIDNFMLEILKYVFPGLEKELTFVYRQEFIIYQEDDEIIASTPRKNEPAVFIDSIELKLPTGHTETFQKKLSGELTLPASVIQDLSATYHITVYFKECFEADNCEILFQFGKKAEGSLVKTVEYNKIK